MDKLLAFIFLAFSYGASFGAENWDFLESNPATSRMIGIRNIVVDKGVAAFFNVLGGYYPNTADLGYMRPVQGRTRSVPHFCGSTTADIHNLWVRDDENKLIIEEEYKPAKSISLQSDDVIRRAALYACGDK